MGWLIGRAAAMADPQKARIKVMEKLQGLSKLDDPESAVVPILIDAILLVECYRAARHEITFLPELRESVDAMLRDLTAIEKSDAVVAR
ncbi:MAG: hypothetical protein HKO13_07515 [Sphingomonas sp.]|nr:hypothetical protein [Sphingomonas sp.]RZV49809.1 MAG: hypothetical protein EX258_06560 [Sphingomonadaceae bacterium]